MAVVLAKMTPSQSTASSLVFLFYEAESATFDEGNEHTSKPNHSAGWLRSCKKRILGNVVCDILVQVVAEQQKKLYSVIWYAYE